MDYESFIGEHLEPPPPDAASFPHCSAGGYWQLIRMSLAEFLSLTALVFVCTTAHADVFGPLSGPVSGAFTVALLIWIFGPVSGGHVNPAVTLYFALTRRLSLLHTICYWVAQTFGAITGSLLGKAVLPSAAIVTTGTEGMTLVSEAANYHQAFAAEVWGTALLVFTVAQSCDELRGKPKLWSIAVVVGFVILTTAICIGPITGCSLNPARSLGPAIVNFNFEAQWLYILAPLFGSIIATVLHEFIFCQDAGLQRTKMFLTKWTFDRTRFYGTRGYPVSQLRTSNDKSAEGKKLLDTSGMNIA